jgi:hypothetical protein
MTGLKIARGLELDADYVGGGTFALLAKKGAGKTYLARVMAEEMWRAKIPFVFLDPMGAAWGLRSSESGASEGIPVAIFGGDHGDAPLERGGGALMADLVVDEGLSMVLDLSGLGSRSAERQFCHDFLERLYRRNSELVHLLMDEADLFAPQQPQAGDRPLLGVTENIVRRGRNRGIGITLISQRPAVLNKDVLTQVDGLVAMRIVGLTDREAIDAWVKGHGDVEAAAAVKGSLSGLENGECWWWVPELNILKRVQVRRAQTFDSSPTKKRGEKKREPKSFADVDMGAIERTMAATIERAKAEDPKALRKTIAELRAQLAKRPTEQVEVEKEVEVPVLDDEHVERLEDALEALSASASKIIAAANEISGGLAKIKTRPPGRTLTTQPAPARAAAPPPPRSAPTSTPPDDGSFAPTPAQRRILNALAMLEVIGVTAPVKTQLALFAQASPKSSGYTNNLGALRSNGLINYPTPGAAALTAAGRAHADASQAPSTVNELHAFVSQLVGPAKARLVEQLVAVYPDALSKAELAERAGASATSSGYTNNLGSLRSLGLIDYPTPGYVAAQPVLFLEAA